MSGLWYLKHRKVIYVMKNGEEMKAEGHFKDGVQPMIEWIYDVKPYNHNGKDYVVVSCVSKIGII